MKYTYIHGCPQKNRIHITGSSDILTTVPKHMGVHYDYITAFLGGTLSPGLKFEPVLGSDQK
jgi:hypothetical protein